MRLQVSVSRHTLPTVNIVFTTGSGPVPHTNRPTSTVADLLHDINELVPLESSDGEWGLEDYVVTLASEHDLEGYECLHYQNIHTVLRDNDTINVRPLSTQDLWHRRLNGRHQISSGGRHLIDGVAFGKQWLKSSARPGFIIPPRKKRRLLETPEQDEIIEEEQLLLEADATSRGPQQDEAELPSGEDDLLTIAEDLHDGDDSEEEDEDYVDGGSIEDDGDDSESEKLDEELENDHGLNEPDYSDLPTSKNHDHNEAMVTTEEYFFDADEEGVDGSSGDVEDDDEVARREVTPVEADGERGRKRKRGTSDLGTHTNDSIWEGFSTPSHTPRKTKDVQGAGNSDTSSKPVKKAVAIISDETSSDTDTTDSSISSNSDDATSQSDSRGDDSVLSSSSSDEADSSPISSAGVVETAQPEQEKPPTDVSIKSATPEVRTSPPGQGSGRTHNNNRRTTLKRRLKRLKEQGILPEQADFQALRLYEADQDNEEMVDEELEVGGMDVEQKRNELLMSLVESSGIEVSDEINTLEEHPERPSPPMGTGRRNRNLKQGRQGQEKVHGEQHDKPDGGLAGGSAFTAKGSHPTEGKPIEQENDALKTVGHDAEVVVPALIEKRPSPEEVLTEPPQKRARLDQSGAARRMIFGALGLRNPKTPEEEQKIREKLSQRTQTKAARQHHVTDESVTVPDVSLQPRRSTWQSKLEVMAVECNYDIVLPPPPFPFKQSWAKGHVKGTQIDEQLQTSVTGQSARLVNYEDSSQVQPPVANTSETLPESEGQISKDQVFESKTISFASDKNEDIPRPQNLTDLPALTRHNLRVGAIIAYKELQLGPNFEPGESAYQVARILSIEDSEVMSLLLSEQDRATLNPARYDPDTGERLFGKFEVPVDEEPEHDDGKRELYFVDMIQPKLIHGLTVQVPDSTQSSGLRGGRAPVSEENSNIVLIPESVGQEQVSAANDRHSTNAEDQKVSTARKQEISSLIKEAGFDSALDDDLLMPIGPSSPARRSKSPNKVAAENSPEHQLATDLSRDLDGGSNENMRTRTNLSPSGSARSVSPRPGFPSSPELSLHETVKYPHLSELEHETPTNGTKINSTNQDAQRNLMPLRSQSVSALLEGQSDDLGIEDDILTKGRVDRHSPEEATQFDSLPSEVPQSQEVAVPDSGLADDESQGMRSFLGGPGLDGPDSSYHDSDRHDSESDLPSLRDLTSSQIHTIKTRSRASHVSPPPLKKGLRSSTVHKYLAESSPDLPSSQPEIKLSQSQGPRLSQLPMASQVVDLTLSSDPVSPVHSDDEFMPVEKSKRKVSASSQVSKTKSRPSGNGVGLGNRRLLTNKKTRSVI